MNEAVRLQSIGELQATTKFSNLRLFYTKEKQSKEEVSFKGSHSFHHKAARKK